MLEEPLYHQSDLWLAPSSLTLKLHVTYLLDSLRSKHQRMLLPHTNTVLNPQPHTPEMLRVRVGIWHVNARFDRNALPCSQLRVAGIPTGVVNVETDVVADVVWKQGVERVAGHVEA